MGRGMRGGGGKGYARRECERRDFEVLLGNYTNEFGTEFYCNLCFSLYPVSRHVIGDTFVHHTRDIDISSKPQESCPFDVQRNSVGIL